MLVRPPRSAGRRGLREALTVSRRGPLVLWGGWLWSVVGVRQCEPAADAGT